MHCFLFIVLSLALLVRMSAAAPLPRNDDDDSSSSTYSIAENDEGSGSDEDTNLSDEKGPKLNSEAQQKPILINGSTALTTDSDRPNNAAVVDKCLVNKRWLSSVSIAELGIERTRLLDAIKRINKQQATFCQPDRMQGQVAYRKCPIWRQKKLVNYYELMKLTYCSDPAHWPSVQIKNVLVEK